LAGGEPSNIETFWPAARFAKNHYAVGIASKTFDVIANPFERRHGIQHPHISGVNECLAA
jgi:hypothetical protein